MHLKMLTTTYGFNITHALVAYIPTSTWWKCQHLIRALMLPWIKQNMWSM